jgi:hypothetical protein
MLKGSTKKAEVKLLYKQVKSYLSRFRVDLWRLARSSTKNHELTMIYAGRKIYKEYLKTVFFEGACREEYLGRRWIFELKWMVNSKTAILVTEYDTNRKTLGGKRKGFMIPFWTGWFVDISEETKKIIKSNSSLESDVRRIRKNKLSYVIIDDLQGYENFYDNMYLPYIQKNYKNTALLMKREEMLKERDRCQLLFVNKEETPIGGILIKFEPTFPRLWSIGIKQANDQYLKDGVVGALYYFSIIHLKEMGYDRVHFGGTRSFLNDGVLNYKKKWPIQNFGFTKKGFQVQVLSYSPDTINLIKNQPFIFTEKGKLYSAVFLPANKTMNPDQIRWLYKSYYLPGIDKVLLFVSGNEKNVVEQAIPLDYKKTFVIREGKHLFS